MIFFLTFPCFLFSVWGVFFLMVNCFIRHCWQSLVLAAKLLHSIDMLCFEGGTGTNYVDPTFGSGQSLTGSKLALAQLPLWQIRAFFPSPVSFLMTLGYSFINYFVCFVLWSTIRWIGHAPRVLRSMVQKRLLQLRACLNSWSTPENTHSL